MRFSPSESYRLQMGEPIRKIEPLTNWPCLFLGITVFCLSVIGLLLIAEPGRFLHPMLALPICSLLSITSGVLIMSASGYELRYFKGVRRKNLKGIEEINTVEISFAEFNEIRVELAIERGSCPDPLEVF